MIYDIISPGIICKNRRFKMAENESCASASSCSRGSCEGCPSHASAQNGTRNTSFIEEPNKNSNIKHVIGIVSGKGGVGKSLVTSSLAGVMARAGYSVGILDADITGPSIPKMFGVHGPAAANAEGVMLPEVAEDGTKIMSVNLILDDEEQPVIWRGPVVAGVVKQFWTDVQWGDIDYLFVDMPPGTGDVPLTCFQSLPVDGIVIVTSPQELVQMIVKKAYNMADMMHIPVLGLVENYSYIACPDCGKKIEIFGESHIDEVAGELNVPVIGKLPMDRKYATAADAGRIFDVENEYLVSAKEILEKL